MKTARCECCGYSGGPISFPTGPYSTVCSWCLSSYHGKGIVFREQMDYDEEYLSSFNTPDEDIEICIDCSGRDFIHPKQVLEWDNCVYIRTASFNVLGITCILIKTIDSFAVLRVQ
jgi:hypothetical protein